MYKRKKNTVRLLEELTRLRHRVRMLEAADRAHAHTPDAVPASAQCDRLYVEHGLGLMCLHDLEGRVLAVNPPAARALGYAPDDLQGQPLRRFLAPAVQPHVDAYLARIRQQPADGGVIRVVTKTGAERVWVYQTVRYEEPGQAPVVIGHAQDLTAGAPAPQLLTQLRHACATRGAARMAAGKTSPAPVPPVSETTYRTLVEVASVAMVIVHQGQVVYSNPAATRLAGAAWPVAGQAPRAFAAWFAPEDRAQVEAYDQQRGEALPASYEAALLGEGGRRVPVECTPCVLDYQGTSATMVILRDITARKWLTDDLLRATKLEALGLLAGGIAHDVNNFLTTILINISLAKRWADPQGKLLGRLTATEQACRQATELTHQLLTFAQGGPPQRQTASIAALLHEAVGLVLRGSPVRADLTLAPELWPVDMDPGQMRQVLHYLLQHAKQAMPAGGVIQVQAENLSGTAARLPLLPQGRWIQVTLRDHGGGIPGDQLAKVFDPYFATKPGSSGLGLAIANAIVAKHEGRLTVTSAVGVGTTVTLWLPASAHPLARPPAPPPPAVPAGQGTILVMDDDAALREVVAAVLTQLGYASQGARDGQEALALYQQAWAAGTPFTAVLLDLTIPGGMGAQETLAALRALDPQVRAIVSSGYVTDPLLTTFRDAGFCGALAKPYTVEGLQAVLQQALEGQPP
jgi:PAS domain S-box-containing protein